MEKVEDYRDPEVLRRMYVDEGLGIEDMADELYCSTTTVRKWLAAAGISRRPQVPKLRGNINYRDKQTLQGLVDQGLSTKEIAKMSNITPGVVTRWKRRLGVRTPADVRAAKQGQLFDAGGGRMLTVRQIAKIAGVNASTIAGRISRGWKPEDLTKPSQWGTDFVRGRQAANLKKQTGRFK